MSLNFAQARDLLNAFRFKELFIEHLGWSNPPSPKAVKMSVKDARFTRQQIADLSGVGVYEIQAEGIPDSKTRAAIHKEISQIQYECLLIFVDQNRTQSVWHWLKRHEGKSTPREHFYATGQPGDLFISKISAMVFELSEFEANGRIAITQVAERLKEALDVERVTKRFFGEFAAIHDDLVNLITGIPNPSDRRWYASILLNRLMFIYFLQRKGFLDHKNKHARDGNTNYLQDKLAASKAVKPNSFFSHFLQILFFEGFAKPEDKRSAATRAALGAIRYLNGGLFLPHRIEMQNSKITIPDEFFDRLLNLFAHYSWNLNDTPGGDDNEISPHVLGYIFEKYINQKAFGAYYTRPEITDYLCERTIHQLILDAINTPGNAPTLPGAKVRNYQSVPDLLIALDAPTCRKLLHDVLPNLALLDPACGSGAFLVAAMNTLINVYSAVTGRIKFLNDSELLSWLQRTEREHANIAYYIKKRIITDNLFGVDIMEEATEIARLRLFLALVASAQTVEQLEPLPNIDFNILPGNSLIGLLRVDDQSFEKKERQGNLFRQRSYREILGEKNRLIDNYRHATTYADDLTALRNEIDKSKRGCADVLDDMLLDEFEQLGIKYEQAVWDASKNREGKPKKRSMAIADIQRLKPFHWGFEFDRVLNDRGGFDAIITNPPWEILKPNGKEFFLEYSDLVSKKKMLIHDFEKEQSALLAGDADIRKVWLDYLSEFPHQSAFFRAAPQFRNQISLVDGKKAGTDINLYKLFTEQCYNLLRPRGLCGIVIPSGIYTDLGSKQLREMLFDKTSITGLFGFENRKNIFDGVHRSFKFVVLTFQKDGATELFPAAFMRHDVADLEQFPQHGAVPMRVELIRRLSPDSLSIMEFKGEQDAVIAEKMLKYPLLGETLPGVWNVQFTREFDMTNDSDLFKTEPGKGRLPLYEGKMIWQFEHKLAPPRYWVDEKEGRARVLGREEDVGQKLDYQDYRLGFRDIAANTNERTLVASVIPSAFHGNKIPTICRLDESGGGIIGLAEQVFLGALLNSFATDWVIRMKVTTTLNFFYIYQLPVPRLTEKDPQFAPIVERSARLICTAPEFDDLARQVGLKSHKDGATTFADRAKLRAELDGLIAHLYGLTEAEFVHILRTFPLVPDPVKVAAHNAYRDVERGLIS
ncbi:MAG: Eco57I restriction-modification methylase domain-containing protein [Phycisphaerae bacterium]